MMMNSAQTCPAIKTIAMVVVVVWWCWVVVVVV